jgi:hypothetical protein
MPFPRLQVGRKTPVLHPTCDLQFMRWNRTIYFSRTFSWHGNAWSEFEMLLPSPNLLLFFAMPPPPLLIGSAYCIPAAVVSSLFPPLPSLPASVGRAAEAAQQQCGNGGQCGGSISSAWAMEAAQWQRWRRWRRQAVGRRQRRRQSGSGGGSTATAVAERQQGDRAAAMAVTE